MQGAYQNNILVYKTEKHQFHFGKKFYLRNDGYWASTLDSGLLAHRWVWINTHYFLSPDMEIHHIDQDKSNNHISNLQLVSSYDHRRIHWRLKNYNPNQLLLAI